MKINSNEWNAVEEKAEGSGKITPGAYIMVIKGAVDCGNYLELKLDFAPNERHSGLLTNATNGNLAAWWSMMTLRLYYGSGIDARFKGNIRAIELSNYDERNNEPYSFEHHNFDENSLIGLNVVGVLYEDEYINKQGVKAVSLKLDRTLRSIKAFQEGRVQPLPRQTVEMKEEAKARKQAQTGVFEPSPINNTPNAYNTPRNANFGGYNGNGGNSYASNPNYGGNNYGNPYGNANSEEDFPPITDDMLPF